MRTFDERILNCNPSRNTETDWTYDNAVEAEVVQKKTEIPETVDLRNPDLWPADDQGSTGSCVGWSTANSVLRYHFVKAGKLDKKEKVSARHIWMASKETDIYTSYPTTFLDSAGTSLKAALDIARKHGTVPESVLPFKDSGLYSGDPETFYIKASKLRITSYFTLGRDLNNWRKWLALEGPVLTRLDVDSSWRNATANNGNLDNYDASTKGGGHAIALVGYTRDRFIVRNSWGEDWGDGGFAYASDSYALEAFTEAYGIII